MIPLTPLPTPEHYSIFFIIVLDNSGCRFLNFSLDYRVQLVTFFLLGCMEYHCLVIIFSC